jgi:phenylacetate-CoA ligase
MAHSSTLPTYHFSLDWNALYEEYPLADVWYDTVFKWQFERVRALQNRRFLETVAAAWNNGFYRRHWRAAGLEPGDIRSIEDIVKLPTFTSDDIKEDQRENAPFGLIPGVEQADLGAKPLKVQTSGGTTGKPRSMMHSPREWEVLSLTGARGLYAQGARPGDVMQIPVTCATAMLGWAYYKSCHDYLGILPRTTGSGVVTPSRRQIEIAFDFGTKIWMSFPEYLIRLAQAAKDDFGRDIRELNTKFLTSFLGPDVEGTLRRQLEDMWGCPVYDNYGINEIGLGSFEGPEKDGRYFMEDCTYFEILDTETSKPVPTGEVGNMVATCFYRQTAPMIRYNLRDLTRILPGKSSALGSEFRRMDHFLGRSDDMVKLRGTNVYPMACLSAVKSDSRTSGEWVCVVDRVVEGAAPRDEMTVHIELQKDPGELRGLKEHLEARLRSDLGVSVGVALVEPGGLAALSNLGLGEGKAKRLLDRRPEHQKKL